MNEKYVVKADVQQEVERLETEMGALYQCVEGYTNQKEIELGITDDTKFPYTSYTYGDLTTVNLIELDACLERVKTELKLLKNVIKRPIRP